MPTNHLGFDFSSVNRLWLILDAQKIDSYVAAERLFGADDEFTQGVLSSLTKDVNSLVWC